MALANPSFFSSIGILLLDPTIQEGYPLWRGYRNWEATPPVEVNPPLTRRPPEGPQQKTFFDDFIFWACRPQAFAHSATADSSSATHVPVQALLHLICAEWLTIADYIKTRLNQIDWEIAYPEHFLYSDKSDNQIDTALKKLHMWRRLVPLYREMLNETLLRVFRFPCSSQVAISNNDNGGNGTDAPNNQGDQDDRGSISSYKRDFRLALSSMEEYQERIDRLTLVVTAVINIADARRGYSDNKNLGRLTWLATLFIPLSFIATMLSMQPDVTMLADTVQYWAIAAIPAAFGTMFLVVLLSLPVVERIINGFPWIGHWRPLAMRGYRKV
jgi:hypothetical protein